MTTRREFMGEVLAGTGALAMSGILSSRRVLGANDRVRIGLIGAGGRGQEILKAAIRCANTEVVAVSDIYTRRLEEVGKFVPGVKTHRDFRSLLDDKTIDAVLIATPQHQHALQFVPAIQAGKDVYQEKTMAFNPDHAKRMRSALRGSGRVVQIGIQSTSTPAVERAGEFLRPEQIGVVTAIHAHHYRNAPYGGWKRAVPADCDPQHFNWDAFQGEARKCPFDPNRAINWRFYWDYSGGNVFENMVHQVGFWNKVMNLGVPASVTMTGANYRSPEMEVPDTMDVSMIQDEKLLFTWNSMFGNAYYGEGDDLVLGDKGTIHRDPEERVRFEPQGRKRQPAGKPEATGAAVKPPDIVGDSESTDMHMRNFFDCIRSRKEPNCPLEIGFRSAIACQMAVESYRRGRTVRWDKQREEIV